MESLLVGASSPPYCRGRSNLFSLVALVALLCWAWEFRVCWPLMDRYTAYSSVQAIVRGIDRVELLLAASLCVCKGLSVERRIDPQLLPTLLWIQQTNCGIVLHGFDSDRSSEYDTIFLLPFSVTTTHRST